MPIGPNPTCQHNHVDIATGKCKKSTCEEQMIGVYVTHETVKSAPNLAPGSGVYIPDEANMREVVVGTNYEYQCVRCSRGEHTIIDSDGTHWSCGTRHLAYVPETDSVR